MVSYDSSRKGIKHKEKKTMFGKPMKVFSGSWVSEAKKDLIEDTKGLGTRLLF